MARSYLRRFLPARKLFCDAPAQRVRNRPQQELGAAPSILLRRVFLKKL